MPNRGSGYRPANTAKPLGPGIMKHALSIAAAFLVLPLTAAAGERLDGAAVRALLTGNTAQITSRDGVALQNYFAPDGTLVRLANGKVLQGRWSVKDDGTQCVDGLPGGCATVEREADGTLYRVVDGLRLKWVFVNGKSF